MGMDISVSVVVGLHWRELFVRKEEAVIEKRFDSRTGKELKPEKYPRYYFIFIPTGEKVYDDFKEIDTFMKKKGLDSCGSEGLNVVGIRIAEVIPFECPQDMWGEYVEPPKEAFEKFKRITGKDGKILIALSCSY